MKAKLSRAVARVFWFIGERLFTVSEAFESLGDRINLIGVKRALPSEINQIFYVTAKAHSKKMTSDAIKKNAPLDDKTVGGIDRRPPWWRQ